MSKESTVNIASQQFHSVASAIRDNRHVNDIISLILPGISLYEEVKIFSFCSQDVTILSEKDKQGNTLLHLACVHASNDANQSYPLIGFLANLSANPSVHNNKGQTPFDLYPAKHTLPFVVDRYQQDLLLPQTIRDTINQSHALISQLQSHQPVSAEQEKKDYFLLDKTTITKFQEMVAQNQPLDKASIIHMLDSNPQQLQYTEQKYKTRIMYTTLSNYTSCAVM